MKMYADSRRFCALLLASLLVFFLAGCTGMGATDSLIEDPVTEEEVTSEETAMDTTETEAAEEMAAEEMAAVTVEDAAVEEEVVTTALLPKLTDIKLEQTSEQSNMLVAEMEAAGFYTFTKTAPSEYVLTLEKATMDADVRQAIISPRGKGQIRSVRTVSQDEGVALRIFAEPDTLLTASAKGGNIVVTAYNESEEEIMAQADIEMAEAETDEEVLDADEFPEEDLPDEDDLEGLLSGEQQFTGRLISLDLQDTDIDNALRIIAEVSNLNIIASDDVTGKVTLRLIDVPWDQALDVILKTNGLDKVQEGNVIRIAPVEKLRQEREALRMAKQAEEELEPMRVQYIRISYAKASELQPLVETVLSERGSVTYDDRTNQLIIKDIRKGLTNVARLVKKLDLRTPQVLIETQIVEAERSFARDLGSELGFYYLRSPETGNATGYNFPNSIGIGGSAQDSEGNATGNASSYGAADQRSAIDVVLGSADGSKGLHFRLSQGEQEGRARVVSRPSVAVTNNTPAQIKSVTKLRIKLPSGGVSVATGQGANATGTSTVATETIEIGIVLNVTAQASPDYYVLMDIDAKSSTLGNTTIGVDNIPPEIERKATSSVLISSGQTFALGGIYQIRENESVDGVPWVKDIPLVGHFFRSTSVSDADEELIFFITPRIIEGSFDDAAMKSAI